jgi:Domain of unknown function (DUF4349)
MRRMMLGWLLLTTVSFAACDSMKQGTISTSMPSAANAPVQQTQVVAESMNKAKSGDEGFTQLTAELKPQTVGGQQGQGGKNSMGKADASQSAAQAFDRKIIRNGSFDIELDQPEAAQAKAATIAESNGGFVVTSEARKTDDGVNVNVVIRVPAAQFDNVIGALRTQLGEKAGGKVLQFKQSGQDVTEEFLDLEAHIKTKKALEDQFLVIMRSASKVADALEVQRQVAEVRGEIEQMEGRRRFLANQSALSTITLAMHTPVPVMLTSSPKGFWFQVRQAFASGVDNALGIVLGVIQFVLLMIPILVLIVLPVAAVFWWLKKRMSWGKAKEATSEVSEN